MMPPQVINREVILKMCPMLVRSGTWAIDTEDELATPSKLLHLVSSTLPQLQVYWTNTFRTDNPYPPQQFDTAIKQHQALGQGMLIEICTRLEITWLLTSICPQQTAAAGLLVLLGYGPSTTSSNWMPPEKVSFLNSIRVKQKRRRASDVDTTRRLLPFQSIVRSHRGVSQFVGQTDRSVLAKDYGTQLRAPMHTLWTAVRLLVSDIASPHVTLDGWLLACDDHRPPLPNSVSVVSPEILLSHEAIQRQAIEDTHAIVCVRLANAVRTAYDRSVWLWLQFRRLLAAGEHDAANFLLDEPLASHTFSAHFATMMIALDLLFFVLIDGGWYSTPVTHHIAAVAHTMLTA